MKAKRQNRATSVSATMLDGTGGHVKATGRASVFRDRLRVGMFDRPQAPTDSLSYRRCSKIEIKPQYLPLNTAWQDFRADYSRCVLRHRELKIELRSRSSV
jgi:hypothetical protein